MERLSLKSLQNWKQHKLRKPLILKGVRQVGKTHLLKVFGEQHFPQCHTVNFEKDPKLAEIFASNLDPQRIIDALSFHLDRTIDTQKDLLIFDEIQECPKALTSLKYFNEEMPELALCAAGSLLGIHLNSGSYPVGKTNTLHLFPMSFEEFLMAVGDKRSVDYLRAIRSDTSIPEVVHSHLWQQLKNYFVVGGLPEPVAIYCNHHDDPYTAFQLVREKQAELIKNYYADMAKHAGKTNAMHLDRLWRAVPAQLALTQDGTASRFKFKDIVPGIDRYSRLVSALDWLEGAGLIMKTHIVHKARIPLSAYTKESTFKLYLFDVGILGAMSGLTPKAILDYQYGTYKGYFAENYVAQALSYAGVDRLYSWQERSSEIEFLRDIDNQLCPIEVKPGWSTQAKSLRVYAEKYHPPYRTIMSANNLSIDKENGVHRYPLYLADRFPLKD